MQEYKLQEEVVLVAGGYAVKIAEQVVASDDLSVTANPVLNEQPTANDAITAVLPDEKASLESSGVLTNN